VIEAEKAVCTIAAGCRALEVSKAGFYAWRRRPESAHEREDRRLGVLVQEAHERSRRTYGSPRVHAELAAQSVRISRKRVIRLMQEQGLKARERRRYKCTTMSDHDLPVAPNLLGRRFEADVPNQRWVGDTTELRIGESGRLVLAVIVDLFSRVAVGWALSAVNDRHLTMKALEMAVRRKPWVYLRPTAHAISRTPARTRNTQDMTTSLPRRLSGTGYGAPRPGRAREAPTAQR
jgi:transposase InsO family protein